MKEVVYEKAYCPVCATEHNLTRITGEIRCFCGVKLYVVPDGFGNKNLIKAIDKKV